MPGTPTAKQAGWPNPHVWHVAGALNALRRTIDESKSIVATSVLLKLQCDYDRLEQRRKRLIAEAQMMTLGDPQRDHDALTQRILQFHRDVGDLERTAERKCMAL